VIDAQHKPIVFYSYTLPSHFARSELAKSGVVVLSGLTHVGVAMRRIADTQNSAAPPADHAALPPRDLARLSEIARPSEFDQQSLTARAGIALLTRCW